jgi:hypothetical protein
MFIEAGFQLGLKYAVEHAYKKVLGSRNFNLND